MPREEIGRHRDDDGSFTAPPDVRADLLDAGQPGAGENHVHDGLQGQAPPQFMDGGREAPGVDLTGREPCLKDAQLLDAAEMPRDLQAGRRSPQKCSVHIEDVQSHTGKYQGSGAQQATG